MNTSQQQSVIYSVLASTIVCTLFLGFNYLEAQWSGAPGNPPNGNIDAPIHTGGGEQMKSNAAVPVAGDRITTGQFLASDMMRSDRYCDASGNNCFGPDDISSSLSLNGSGSRFYYQRVGGDVGQTGEHVVPPPSSIDPNGTGWDFCVVSGNRLFRSDTIHPNDYDVSPEENHFGHERHPDTSYRSVSGGASCSIFRGGSNMRNYSGELLPGGEWTILLAETDPNVVARCIATCYKRTLD